MVTMFTMYLDSIVPESTDNLVFIILETIHSFTVLTVTLNAGQGIRPLPPVLLHHLGNEAYVIPPPSPPLPYLNVPLYAGVQFSVRHTRTGGDVAEQVLPPTRKRYPPHHMIPHPHHKTHTYVQKERRGRGEGEGRGIPSPSFRQAFPHRISLNLLLNQSFPQHSIFNDFVPLHTHLLCLA